MIGYKLLRRRQDGSLGPLFIHVPLRIEPGVWYEHQEIKKKGYAFRPGWHIMERPEAPHLSERGRVWAKVEFEPMGEIERPTTQGGRWFLGRRMRVLEVLR